MVFFLFSSAPEYFTPNCDIQISIICKDFRFHAKNAKVLHKNSFQFSLHNPSILSSARHCQGMSVTNIKSSSKKQRAFRLVDEHIRILTGGCCRISNVECFQKNVNTIINTN